MVVISALDSAFSKSFAYKARYHGYSERFLWTADGVLNKGNDCCFLKGGCPYNTVSGCGLYETVRTCLVCIVAQGLDSLIHENPRCRRRTTNGKRARKGTA